MFVYFFCCKQKTAYEMRISDWSSDVCSSDLVLYNIPEHHASKPALAFITLINGPVVNITGSVIVSLAAISVNQHISQLVICGQVLELDQSVQLTRGISDRKSVV